MDGAWFEPQLFKVLSLKEPDEGWGIWEDVHSDKHAYNSWLGAIVMEIEKLGAWSDMCWFKFKLNIPAKLSPADLEVGYPNTTPDGFRKGMMGGVEQGVVVESLRLLVPMLL